MWSSVVLLNVYLLSNKYGGGLILLPCGSWRMDRSLMGAIVEANQRALMKGPQLQPSTERREVMMFIWTRACTVCTLVMS